MTLRRDASAGVTLVEMLVVLAIVAAVAGISMLGLGTGSRGDRPEAEARRLADRLRLATDEALVTGTPRALVWDATGYRFLAWDAEKGEWRPDGQALLGRPRALPAGLGLRRADGEDAPVLIAADLAVPPVALTIAGAAGAWQVAFDGLAVATGPVGP